MNTKETKQKPLLAYLTAAGQIIGLIVLALTYFGKLFNEEIIFKSTKTHSLFQIGFAALLIYSLYHFIRIKKESSKMRVAARQQKEAKSKRIQFLIFSLITSVMFWSLFYTVPVSKYTASLWEHAVYIVNGVLQLLLLITVINSTDESSKEFHRSKQRYALVGIVWGVVLFYLYTRNIY